MEHNTQRMEQEQIRLINPNDNIQRARPPNACNWQRFLFLTPQIVNTTLALVQFIVYRVLAEAGGDTCISWMIEGIPELFIGNYSVQFLLAVICLFAVAYNSPNVRNDGTVVHHPLLSTVAHLVFSNMFILVMATNSLALLTLHLSENNGSSEFKLYFAGCVFLMLIEEICYLIIAAHLNHLYMHRARKSVRIGMAFMILRYLFSAANLINRLTVSAGSAGGAGCDLHVSSLFTLLYLAIGTYYKFCMVQKMLSKTKNPKHNYFPFRVPSLNADHTWMVR